MGLLTQFRERRRSKTRSRHSVFPVDADSVYTSPEQPPRFDTRQYSQRGFHYLGPDPTPRLPDNVLENIFGFVCPHSTDRSYIPSERSQVGDGCMLCDLRDLSHCAQISRRWYQLAQKLLYTSVRIDAVHYCALEEELSDRRRKHKKAAANGARSGRRPFSRRTVSKRRDSFGVDVSEAELGRAGGTEPEEVPTLRLALLCRTVREQANLAQRVQLLKLPYMTRETAKGELARTVSALPHLQYVDLPDGFFTGDQSCVALRQGLQVRCPDIRKMTYRSGSEEALELLMQRHWQAMEDLELVDLAIEPATLRMVLGSLPWLRRLTLASLDWLDDGIFPPSQTGQLPDFPPLQSLKVEDCPNVTATGLSAYLEDPINSQSLQSLTLARTGVTIQDLHAVLWQASALSHLSVTETVTRSLALATQQQIPPRGSRSLRVLHFEIVSSHDVHGLQKPAESYYQYLATSLHRNALPALTTLYVRDPTFPDMLVLPPPPTFAHTGSDQGSLKSRASNLSSLTAPSLSASGLLSAPNATNHPSSITRNKTPPLPSNNPFLNATTTTNTAQSPPHSKGFTQTLEIYTKGPDELEWVFTSLSPSNPFPSTSSTASTTQRSTHLPTYDTAQQAPRRSSATTTGTVGTAGPFSAALAASQNNMNGRPLSAYSASRGLGPQWAQGGFGGEARKSVMVGNGFGGFIAVPAEEVPRPMTADGGMFPGNGEGRGGVNGVNRASRWGSVGSSSAMGAGNEEGMGGDGGVGGMAGGAKPSRKSMFLRVPGFGGSGGVEAREKRASRRNMWR